MKPDAGWGRERDGADERQQCAEARGLLVPRLSFRDVYS